MTETEGEQGKEMQLNEYAACFRYRKKNIKTITNLTKRNMWRSVLILVYVWEKLSHNLRWSHN